MEMLTIIKEGEITVSFKNNKKFSDFYNPDQVGDVNNTEESTTTKRRKVRNLKLKTIFPFKYLVSRDSSSQGQVGGFLNTQSHRVLSLKPELMFPPMSLAELDSLATKVQKVYRSYRTRRHIADWAVICEELWWKASNFEARNGCSTSHFDSDKSETAISNGPSSRTVAAKVGKGLSKDDKAQKLALRTWLEAIDPRHRYGHNLRFYYDVWFLSQSSQPFFYWLDIGNGKEVDLQYCPRSHLQRQLITYLGPEEREAYEVIVEEGRLVYRKNRELVHTTEGSKWIFVLSSSRTLYVGQKKKGQFQHSSFLAGAATIASGRLVAHHGVLHVIWPYSGHYRPTEKNFKEFICFLEEHNVDMTNVKTHPVDDDVPPPKPVDEELQFEYIEGNNEGSSNYAIASNHHKENLSPFGKNVEDSSLEENKALSSKWTTGVGPRIGCVREYPIELQDQAFEQLNLSPRINHRTLASKIPIPSPRPSPKVHLSPRVSNMGLPSPRVHNSCS